jgi:hypothetical protein
VNHPSPHGTIVSRYLWPQLLANSRAIVAAHTNGNECGLCIEPGDCGRVRGARRYLADPVMLAVERAAEVVATHKGRVLSCCATVGVCPELAGALAMFAEVD